MRIEPVHSETRRVEPVDRQDRRQQQRKDEERPERENLEEAYKLSLRQGKAGLSSPFVPGAYSRVGFKASTPRTGDQAGAKAAEQSAEPEEERGPSPEATQILLAAQDREASPGPRAAQVPSPKPYTPPATRQSGGHLDTYT